MRDKEMDHHTQHACISYIACRLITGKSPAFLYDLTGSQEIEMAGVLDIDFLREFEERHRGYVPGFAGNCTYQYAAGTGFTLNMFINEKTFIVHVNGSAAYYIGNLRSDTIYLYDHHESTHFRYRITAYIEDHRKEAVKPAGEVMYGEDGD
jgi:hypothetical protein